jgi:hypothetical protein
MLTSLQIEFNCLFARVDHDGVQRPSVDHDGLHVWVRENLEIQISFVAGRGSSRRKLHGIELLGRCNLRVVQ